MTVLSLTPRQRQIVVMLSDGVRYSKIARTLGIVEITVRFGTGLCESATESVAPRVCLYEMTDNPTHDLRNPRCVLEDIASDERFDWYLLTDEKRDGQILLSREDMYLLYAFRVAGAPSLAI